MKIAFIAYWGYNQGLTQATVIPHLRILSSDSRVSEITFYTIERSKDPLLLQVIEKVRHVPIQEESKTPGIAKFASLRKIYNHLKTINPALVMSRSSLAGIPAYHYFKKTGTPFTVESFEPHAEYMVDSGEWKRSGLKYKLLKKYERRQVKSAAFLLPVSYNYKNFLIANGAEADKILVQPCTVDVSKFSRNLDSRKRIRKELKISASVRVGIYVGKFDGLYKGEDAFIDFKRVLESLGEYHLIVLSPQEKSMIIEYAKRSSFPIDKMSIHCVPMNKVPEYLSSSDLAFATYKNFQSNKFLSPIKLGEYFANGLFVVCTPGVGDDADRLITNGIGVTTDQLSKFKNLFEKFDSQAALAYAEKYRGRKLVVDSYDRVLSL